MHTHKRSSTSTRNRLFSLNPNTFDQWMCHNFTLCTDKTNAKLKYKGNVIQYSTVLYIGFIATFNQIPMLSFANANIFRAYHKMKLS